MKLLRAFFVAGMFFVPTLLCSQKRTNPDSVAWLDTPIQGFRYGIPGDISQPQGALVKDEAERNLFFVAVKKQFAQTHGFSLDDDESQIYAQDTVASYLFLQNSRCAGGIIWAYITPPTTPTSSPARKILKYAVK